MPSEFDKDKSLLLISLVIIIAMCVAFLSSLSTSKDLIGNAEAASTSAAESPTIYTIGQRIQMPMANTSTCSDTDGGKFYYVKGVVKAKGKKDITDKCLNNNVVVETFCGPKGQQQIIRIKCPYGCSGGVCQQMSEKSYTSGKWNCSNGASFIVNGQIVDKVKASNSYDDWKNMATDSCLTQCSASGACVYSNLQLFSNGKWFPVS